MTLSRRLLPLALSALLLACPLPAHSGFQHVGENIRGELVINVLPIHLHAADSHGDEKLSATWQSTATLCRSDLCDIGAERAENAARNVFGARSVVGSLSLRHSSPLPFVVALPAIAGPVGVGGGGCCLEFGVSFGNDLGNVIHAVCLRPMTERHFHDGCARHTELVCAEFHDGPRHRGRTHFKAPLFSAVLWHLRRGDRSAYRDSGTHPVIVRRNYVQGQNPLSCTYNLRYNTVTGLVRIKYVHYTKTREGRGRLQG